MFIIVTLMSLSINVFLICQDTHNIQPYFSSLSAHPLGWWAGKAEKWRNPFFGEGWRCGVSEANTAKANSL